MAYGKKRSSRELIERGAKSCTYKLDLEYCYYEKFLRVNFLSASHDPAIVVPIEFLLPFFFFFQVFYFLVFSIFYFFFEVNSTFKHMTFDVT